MLFIVNGEDVHVNPGADASMGDARDLALARSKNFGRDFDLWELRDERGWIVDAFLPAAMYASEKIFVTLPIAAGG